VGWKWNGPSGSPCGRSQSLLIAIAAGLSCGPRVDESTETSGGSTSSPQASSGSEPNGGDDGAPTTSSGSGSATTGGSADDDTADDGALFLRPYDLGPHGGCEQPRWVEQARSCGDGVLQPGELCYQGAASRFAMPEGARLADFGQGMRIVYVDLESAEIHLHEATAEGLLAAPTIVSVTGGAYGLAVDDVDDDGRLDIVVAHYGDESLYVSVLRGAGDDTFVPWTSTPMAPEMAHLHVADLDGDGAHDLVGTTDHGYALGRIHTATAGAQGSYVDTGVLDLGEHVWPGIGDLDGDGLDDLALLVTDLDPGVREIVLVPSTADGLGSPQPIEAPSELSRPLIGRFDGDGTLDLTYLRGGELVIRSGIGDGGFAAAEVVEPDAPDWPVAAADLDGDGTDDLIGSSSVRVTTTGEWIDFDVGCGHYGTVTASAADANEDGLLDIVLGTGYGQRRGAVHLVLSTP